MFGADRRLVLIGANLFADIKAKCPVKGLLSDAKREGDKALDVVSAKHVFRTRSVRKTSSMRHG